MSQLICESNESKIKAEPDTNAPHGLVVVSESSDHVDWIWCQIMPSESENWCREEGKIKQHVRVWSLNSKWKHLLTWAWRRSSSSCSRWWRRSGSGRGWAAARCCTACWCSWRPCRNPSPLCSARSTGWPMTCCGVGRREVWGEGEWRRRRGGVRWRGGVRGRLWLGWGEGGEMGGVRKSCRVALAKLTPHSPDQSRQVGGRDGPAPRREEETHCWTNTDERTDRQTHGRRRRRWGMEGWGGSLRTVLCVSVCGAYTWLTLEETRGAARSTEEEGRKRGREFG